VTSKVRHGTCYGRVRAPSAYSVLNASLPGWPPMASNPTWTLTHVPALKCPSSPSFKVGTFGILSRDWRAVIRGLTEAPQARCYGQPACCDPRQTTDAVPLSPLAGPLKNLVRIVKLQYGFSVPAYCKFQLRTRERRCGVTCLIVTGCPWVLRPNHRNCVCQLLGRRTL